MTTPLPVGTSGRPRQFDAAAALSAALDLFWRRGFEATSLDQLTAAMQLSRSSFYNAFGSKHAVLLQSVQHYVDGVHAGLQLIVASADSPTGAAKAVLARLACADGGPEGCLLVNMVVELAPGDAMLAEIARLHITRVSDLITAVLGEIGFTEPTSRVRAATILSCAFGATVLHKAGATADQIAGLLGQAHMMFEIGGTTCSGRIVEKLAR